MYAIYTHLVYTFYVYVYIESVYTYIRVFPRDDMQTSSRTVVILCFWFQKMRNVLKVYKNNFTIFSIFSFKFQELISTNSFFLRICCRVWKKIFRKIGAKIYIFSKFFEHFLHTFQMSLRKKKLMRKKLFGEKNANYFFV